MSGAIDRALPLSHAALAHLLVLLRYGVTVEEAVRGALWCRAHYEEQKPLYAAHGEPMGDWLDLAHVWRSDDEGRSRFVACVAAADIDATRGAA